MHGLNEHAVTAQQVTETAGVQLRRTAGALVGVGLVANVLAEPLRALGDARDTDFTSVWAAGRMVAHGASCLYCLGDQRAALTANLGVTLPASWNVYFVNPPAAAWLVRPLALLPLSTALALYVAGGLFCMVMAAIVAWRAGLYLMTSRTAALIAVAAVFTLPAAHGLALGQWDPYLVLPAMLAVLWLRRDDHDVAAGLLLALLLVKAQVAFLVPPMLLLLRRGRASGGFAAGFAVWVVSSALLAGSGIVHWPGALTATSATSAPQTLGLPGLVALLTGNSTTVFVTSVVLSCAAVAIAITFRRRLRTDTAAAVSLSIAVSLLVAPHMYWDDFAMLSPLLVVWALRQPWQSLTAALSLSAAFALDALRGLPGFHLETAVLVYIIAAASRALFASDAVAARRTPRSVAAETARHAVFAD